MDMPFEIGALVKFGIAPVQRVGVVIGYVNELNREPTMLIRTAMSSAKEQSHGDAWPQKFWGHTFPATLDEAKAYADEVRAEIEERLAAFLVACGAAVSKLSSESGTNIDTTGEQPIADKPQGDLR